MAAATNVPRGLRPQELETVYAISRAIAQSLNVDAALDQIVHLTRHILIFDNMVLYLAQDNEGLEPAYARVIGRGRSAEADLAWGGRIAQQAFQSGQPVVRQEKLEGWQADRLSWRDFLALPLRSGEGLLGSLVVGRFGGPPYSEEQVGLAEFIAAHIAQLLEHQKLVERVAALEAERRLQILQSDFIATVSHELVTPLGFIKGYATTLLRQDIEWEESTRREFLSIISEEADRLRELIDDLLDSSRLQAGTMRMQFQSVNLDQLLGEVVMREFSRTRDLTIQLQVNSDALIWADPIRIAQVLQNLLSNAAKYAPGSPVYITIDRAGELVHLAVQDQGPGIAPEHLERLFERFYRVPAANGVAHGAGLGLFICRQIVQAHGGRITVESEQSKGTTFHVYLPVTQQGRGDRTSPQEAET
jgi:K+-sensing histidine kinase KdpD